MRKYAFIIASLLALTGCEHYKGNSGYSQKSNNENYGTAGTESQSSSFSANHNPAGSNAITPGTVTPGLTGQSSEDLGAGDVGQSANANGTAGQTGSINQSGLAQGALDQNAPATGAAGQSTTGTGSSTSDQSALQSQANQPSPSLDMGNQFAAPVNAADQAITQSVTNALMASEIPPEELSNVHVRASNGKIILSGQVPDTAARDRIEKQVKQTPGVQTVINQLRVRAGAGQSNLETTPPAGRLNPDTSTTPGAGQTTTPGGP
jgi:osmotically-inducible protein OsmY